jgi:hypothetical protein
MEKASMTTPTPDLARVRDEAQRHADEISERIQSERYRATLSDVETLRNDVRRLLTALDSSVEREKRIGELEEELRRLHAGCNWYWPEDDTSSDSCFFHPSEALQDAPPGVVVAVSRGGIVETRYYAFLDPALDADSDDEFEVDEPTREQAEAKLTAEKARRAALPAPPSLDLTIGEET